MAMKKVEPQRNGLDKEFEELKAIVESAYESAVDMMEAERLAARFLSAQMQIASELAKVDLDARMRKSGVKAVRAEVYKTEMAKYDKKPSDSVLEAEVNSSEIVRAEQDAFDKVDSRNEILNIYLGIFKDAHIFFRTVSKGKFD